MRTGTGGGPRRGPVTSPRCNGDHRCHWGFRQQDETVVCVDAARSAEATCWPHGVRAQVGTGELVARLSFVLLIPIGIVQILAAAKVSSILPRRWTGLTAVVALLSCGAGFAAAISDGDAHTIGVMLAVLACLPGVPISIGLVRQKMWGVIWVAVVLPAAVGVFIILDGAWK
jgi:hypothetical protein